jgi:hypothetical protein
MTVPSLLPGNWNVPRVFRDRLGRNAGRQRLMLADGHLLLVLHAPPSPEERNRQGRFFWRSPEGTWQSNSLGPGIKALEKHLGEYAQAVEKLEDAEDRAQLADEYFPILQAITPLRRAAKNLHDVLQEARQAARDDQELIACRDQAYIIHRSAELLQSDMKTGLDCAVVRQAENEAKSGRQMALAGHRLNVLAALFFPIATVATIFGMNLENGLEHALTPVLFWVVLVVGVIVGLLLKAAIVNDRSEVAEQRRRLNEPPR